MRLADPSREAGNPLVAKADFASWSGFDQESFQPCFRAIPCGARLGLRQGSFTPDVLISGNLRNNFGRDTHVPGSNHDVGVFVGTAPPKLQGRGRQDRAGSCCWLWCGSGFLSLHPQHQAVFVAQRQALPRALIVEHGRQVAPLRADKGIGLDYHVVPD